VDDVHLVIEVRQSSVDIVEFKAAVGGYFILVHDGRSQVGAHDFHMRVLVGHGCGPEEDVEIKRGSDERSAYQIPLPHPESRGEASMSEAYEG